MSRELEQMRGDVPFRYLGEYSLLEKAELYGFMTENYSRAVINKRGMSFTVEDPPPEIIGRREWRKLLHRVLVPEIGVFHPDFRKNPTVVRFVKSQQELESGAEIGGSSELVYEKNLVRVAYIDDAAITNRPMILLFVMMHEICERDFWFKTATDDHEADSLFKNEMKAIIDGDLKYHDQLDEKIANQRALRAIQRVWPKAILTSDAHLTETEQE